MTQQKIPFDASLAERAIANYLRKNVSSLTFRGKVSDVDSISTVQIGTITCLEDKNHYEFNGILGLKYQLDDGTMDCPFNISASCTMVINEEEEVVIKDMSIIQVKSKR